MNAIHGGSRPCGASGIRLHDYCLGVLVSALLPISCSSIRRTRVRSTMPYAVLPYYTVPIKGCVLTDWWRSVA